MRNEKFRLLILLCVFFGYSFFWLPCPSSIAAPSVRIKDIAHVLEARDNQVMGFGLVVGLRNTGDRGQTGFTEQALTNLLSRMGVVPQSVNFKTRNAAAVMVTATLPPFVRSGQKLDVTVSSVGDAVSLQGGTLLITPLRGVDDQVYAVAQGSLVVGEEANKPFIPYVRQKQLTVGRVPGGALVEKEIPVSIGEKGVLSIVINDPDFTTANRIAASIQKAGYDAVARDAGTVTLNLVGDERIVPLVSQLENLSVVPDIIAKIIVNERSGTIVIGENVKLSAVAVSYGGIDVMVGDINLYAEGNESDYEDTDSRFRTQSMGMLQKKAVELKEVSASVTLTNLAKALNTLGATPKELIAILQAMKKAGAINAELEVI